MTQPSKTNTKTADEARVQAIADKLAKAPATGTPATPPVKKTRVKHPTTGIKLEALTIEDAPAPARTVAGRNPADNPFIAILGNLWSSRAQGSTKSAGKAVTVPVAAEREVCNAIRAAADYHTKNGTPMGTVIDTDTYGDGSKPAVKRGEIRIRFAAKQRKNKRTVAPTTTTTAPGA